MKYIIQNSFLSKIVKLFKIKRKETEINQLINNYKKQEVNMNDLMQSINKSNDLYNKMKVEFHPDKYQNSIFYNEIVSHYQEITKSKRDYLKLFEINEKLNNLLNNKNTNYGN